MLSLKILLLSEYLFGGGGTAFCNLAKYLSNKRSIDLAVFTVGEMPETLENVKTFYVPARSFKKPESQAMSFIYIYNLLKTIRQNKPDIVHANGMYTGMMALLLKRTFSFKYKIMMTLHHTSGVFRFNLIAKRIIHLLNNVDLIHYLTPYQKKLYESLGLNPRSFRFIPNIIETKKIDQELIDKTRKELQSKTHSETLAVYVGRLTESKQIDMVIKVIQYLRAQNLSVGACIVGTGDKDYESYLKNLAEELKVEKYICFTGFSTRPELFLETSDFGLFPTQWQEALPCFILESFSLGKTMIVSNIPQLETIVENRKDSLVVNEHSVQEYSRLISELINHPTLRKNLEKGAIETFDVKYSPDIVIQEYVNCYHDLFNAQLG